MINKVYNNQQTGAALIAVLVVALILVLLMGVVSNLMQNRISIAHHSKNNWQDKAAIQAKRSEIVYLLATQRHTVAGISKGEDKVSEPVDGELRISSLPFGDEIRTDGFLIEEESGISYRIQNTAGLIAINSADQTWLKEWLSSKGYTRSEQAKFYDSLADYADPDNIRRAAGAEANRLVTNQNNLMLQPRNFLLQSCSELWRVQNWPSLLTNNQEFLEFCSLRRTETINLNALPLSLWEALWPSSVEKVASSRQNNNWFLSFNDIINIEPSLISVSEDYYSHVGGRSFKVKIKKGMVSSELKVEINKGLVKPFNLKN